MTEHEFKTWFTAQNLGPLEDVREYVEAHARENASNCDDVWTVARETVMFYLDDPNAASVFDAYRNT